MEGLTEEQLVNEIRQGHSEAYRILVDRQERKVSIIQISNYIVYRNSLLRRVNNRNN
ncbi:hypothetical protein [Paenibacillus sp. IHBB 10380]|uniref:hypothetical protein n=1 Tax=Paenibacillus sp. IHBB 10380 TaxID=1566358 RepID=UPI000B1EB4BF|nr:hypothetical protein [Paenibacillus sp. IHBB 10380]